jgi:hypothetical protein
MEHKVKHQLGLPMAKKATDAALKAYAAQFAEYDPTTTWTDEQHARVTFNVKGLTLKGGLDRMDADELRPSSAVDGAQQGSRALLRRHGSPEERAHHDDDELRGDGGHRGAVGADWLRAGLRQEPGRVHRLGLGLTRAQRTSTWRSSYADKGIPELVFVMFQGKFAIITPALISGAVAERMRFRSYLAFTVVWATLVYCPLAHWVWASDGWLFKRACSTSPVARWCTSRLVSRRWCWR